MEKNIFHSDNFRLALLTTIVFLSRLPFLWDGFGLDGDSWSVAITAQLLNDADVYEASRLPGFPVHEILSSYFISAGALGTNLLSAIAGTLCVLFFALTLKTLRFKYVIRASLAFAAVPVFYIHSTTTIDYVLALMFIMASLYLLHKDHLVFAGIALGLAIGTRLTSGAMLLPLSILLLEQIGFRRNLFRIVKLTVPALIVAAICFMPVINEYGLNFFTYYNVPYPSIPKVLYKFSIEVWGIIGFIGISLGVLMLFLPDRITGQKYLFPRSVNEKHVIAWLVAIDLFIIAFLKLPMEAGYLIPIIPFTIMLFGKYLYTVSFSLFCSFLILAPFVAGVGPRDRLDASTASAMSFSINAAGEELIVDMAKGPVPAYQSRRANGMQFTENLLQSFDSVSVKSVLVAGRWYNQLIVLAGDTVRGNMVILDYMDEQDVHYYFAKDYVMYYMPKQDYYNKVMRNVDLEIYEAKPYLGTENY